MSRLHYYLFLLLSSCTLWLRGQALRPAPYSWEGIDTVLTRLAGDTLTTHQTGIYPCGNTLLWVGPDQLVRSTAALPSQEWTALGALDFVPASITAGSSRLWILSAFPGQEAGYQWQETEAGIAMERLPRVPEDLALQASWMASGELWVAGKVRSTGSMTCWRLLSGSQGSSWVSYPWFFSGGEQPVAAALQTYGEGQALYLLVQGQAGWYFRIKAGEKLVPEKGGCPALPPGALRQNRIFVAPIGLHDLWVSDGVANYTFHVLTCRWTHWEEPPSVEAWSFPFFWEGLPFRLTQSGAHQWTIEKGTAVQQMVIANLSLAVIVAYLSLLVLMGIYFSRRQKSTEDFFLAGGRIPWWAAGISIFGTQLSAITFMAVPAKTYATDWRLLVLPFTIVLAAPFVIRWFLPFYRKQGVYTAYEYLEKRFNLATRLMGSLLYIAFQLGRLGIILLLPGIALSVVTGIGIEWCILTMGLLSILYTVLGGIEAVIWTDVLQVGVLLGGAIGCLILMGLGLEGSWADQADLLAAQEKTRWLDLALDVQKPTFWVVLLGGFAGNLTQYGTDQTVVQRYLTTAHAKQAAKGIRLGAWMALPSSLLFFTIGTALYLTYAQAPERLPLPMENGDAIFPWFMVNELPPVWAGLMLAAIFAAAMSSLDSSMNSVATVLTHDGFRRFAPGRPERQYLRFARWCTFGIGGIATGTALVMASWGIGSLWDQFNLIVGLFAGGIGGVFLLGLFSRRAHGWGALAGLLASAILQWTLKSQGWVHLQLYAFTGLVAALVLGYVFSFLPGRNKDDAAAYTLRSSKPTITKSQ